jgi:hypothetical protein
MSILFILYFYDVNETLKIGCLPGDQMAFPDEIIASAVLLPELLLLLLLKLFNLRLLLLLL